MNDEIKLMLNIIKDVSEHKAGSRNGLMILSCKDYKTLYNYITNLQQAFERSYTEEQLDFAVNEVKEQLKIEKQYSNQLCNEIDKLRVKNYELQQENERLKQIFAKIKDLNTMQYLNEKNFKYSLNEILQNGSEEKNEC